MSATTVLEIRDLVKRFGDRTVLDGIDLTVHEGEFLTLLGPSGCGKTSTIRVLAGFLSPTQGSVLMDGEDITHLSPQRRDIGMMFQNYALFPHMTVEDNVAYGLRIRRWSRDRIKARVADLLDMVQLTDYGTHYPGQISGGMAQRVALARALAPEPRILLMDEPLAALDPKLRKSMQAELKRIQHMLGVTTVYVTHDQEEALAMSDRIVVMNEGSIAQISSASDLYRRPTSRFVADFVGTINFLDARVVRVGKGLLTCTVAQAEITAAGDGREGEKVTLGLRPEDVTCKPTEAGAAGVNSVEGTIDNVSFGGSVVHVSVQVPALSSRLTTTMLSRDYSLTEGDRVCLQWRPEDIVVLDSPNQAASGRVPVAVGAGAESDTADE